MMTRIDDNTRFPRVYITEEAKKRLDLYVKFAPAGEISGLGCVEPKAGDLLITDLFLFKQVSGPATTELDGEAVSNFLVEAITNGIDPSDLKLWWHSHGEMSVFWSGTDQATAGAFGNQWMLCLVANKQGDVLVRLDLYEPVPITLDGLKLEILLEPDEELAREIEAEVEQKVSVPLPPMLAYPRGGRKNVAARGDGSDE